MLFVLVIAAELKKTLKTCRGSVEACEGQVEAHGDLLEDSKKRILSLEAQADTWAAKYDTDTAALSVSLKESQAAKAECVGKSEQSDALIAECKKTVGQLERTVNATAAKLENTTAALEGSIKICQDEKQKCVGESKAATAIIADIRDNVDDLESKLKTAESEFNRTSTAFTMAIETLQQEKQKCVGESAAAKELIGECAKARAYAAELSSLAAEVRGGVQGVSGRFGKYLRYFRAFRLRYATHETSPVAPEHSAVAVSGPAAALRGQGLRPAQLAARQERRGERRGRQGRRL